MSSSKTKNPVKKSNIISIEVQITRFTQIAWTLAVIGAIALFYGLGIYFHTNDEAKFSLSSLGDYVGGTVGSIWSLAGLFFVYVAFLGQKLQLAGQQEELELNRKEVTRTADEMTLQREEMQAQNLHLEVQRFDNTFFNLIGNLNHLINTIDLRAYDANENLQVTSSGHDALLVYHKRLLKIIEFESDMNKVSRMYLSFFKMNQSDLQIFVNNVIIIMELISNNKKIDRIEYATILVNQLTYQEVAIIAYHALFAKDARLFNNPYLIEYLLAVPANYFSKNPNMKLIILDCIRKKRRFK